MKSSITEPEKDQRQIVMRERRSGAEDDLKQATILARRMISQWGMSKMGPIFLLQEFSDLPG